MLSKAGSQAGVEKRQVKFTLSGGTYSIDNFNTKFKTGFLQQGPHRKAPQIKDLKLVIPKQYTFMTSNSFFIALGIPNNYLE